MARLRAEGGCPWDREQDLRSLRPYLVEETFEVLDEMDRVAYGGAWRPLCEELGDLLFQIVFHAQLAERARRVHAWRTCAGRSATRSRAATRTSSATSEVDGAEQVLDELGEAEGRGEEEKTGSEGSVLDGVPTAAPALLRAERLTEKASRIGFDWPDIAGVRAKLDEELRELDEAIASGTGTRWSTSWATCSSPWRTWRASSTRRPRTRCAMAIRRFTTRFQHIETALRAEGVAFGEATLEQMERTGRRPRRRRRPCRPPPPRAAAPLVALRFPVRGPRRPAGLLGHRGPPARLEPERGGPERGRLRRWRPAPASRFTAGAGSPLGAAPPCSCGAPSAAGGGAAALGPGAHLAPGARPGGLDVGQRRLSFRDPAGLRWRIRPSGAADSSTFRRRGSVARISAGLDARQAPL